ncbi:E3 ubiquitin-protein ligase, ATL family [Zostera marina]|uniref:RING-type E3 ubiquitin transferase n=1 Tax=Zostera marina TaxID=29655 RepID=A0A0K9P0P1_ZOSMR|nr:E3 ubiquitin-protein ligase, ATL family [Zostera marina]
MVVGRPLIVFRQIFRRLCVPGICFVSVVFMLMLPVISAHGRTNPSEPPQYNMNQRFSTTSAIVIVVLMLGFFITGFLFIFIHCRRVANNNLILAAAARAAAEGGENNGLRTEIIDSLPTMVYSKVKGLKKGNSPLECAVCLCEFEDDDELTLLPKCYHAFHPQCIGVWLANHITCPVCRIDLGEPVLEVIPVTEEISLTPPVIHLSDENENVVEITDEQQRTPPAQVSVKVEEEEKEVREIGSLSKRTRSTRILRRWRSRSARLPMSDGGDGIGKTWREEERERFTLRVPENLRKELIEATSSTLRRSASVTTTTSRHLFNHGVGDESSRSTFRARGSPSPIGKMSCSPLGKTTGSPSPLGKMSKQGKSWTEKMISKSGPLDCIGGVVGRNGAGSDTEDSTKSTVDLLPRV